MLNPLDVKHSLAVVCLFRSVEDHFVVGRVLLEIAGSHHFDLFTVLALQHVYACRVLGKATRLMAIFVVCCRECKHSGKNEES